MADQSNKSGFSNEPTQAQSVSCEVCEVMCLDAVDGALSAAEQQAFDLHVSTCATCAAQLAEAQRGAAWMDMLKSHRPAPSANLLANILAKTTGIDAAVSAAHVSVPAVTASKSAALPSAIVTLPNGKLGIAAGMLPGAAHNASAAHNANAARKPISSSWLYGGMQPRMAMTAAMAFFSLALTLNMMGVRLTDLHPDSLRRTAKDARTSVVRTFENNRMVYQVESRVSDMKQGGPGQ